MIKRSDHLLDDRIFCFPVPAFAHWSLFVPLSENPCGFAFRRRAVRCSWRCRRGRSSRLGGHDVVWLLGVALLWAGGGDFALVLNCGGVGVSSPFRGEYDICACGCIYGKGECVVYKNLLGVVGFITDLYTAIARCACRSGGFQLYHTDICCQRISSSGFGKLGWFPLWYIWFPS